MEAEDQLMYRDIHLYRGDFGDGVDTGSVTPFAQFAGDNSESVNLRGAGVRLLCWLSSEIDNSTYLDTLQGKTSKLARHVLNSGVLIGEQEITTALETFFVSEVEFYEALSSVYTCIVKPEIERGETAT